ncbi:hypothetical protein IJG78_03885 [Candidatus Saccharibacteria bacterium]|nr:hypothetical protein [Candidatus Saccharibacteria bacterium]
MSKSTKIIAALGVVAGIGAAALPMASYATQSVSGNVDLYVEVPEAIAMTIVGNNDDTATQDQTYTTDPVTTGVDNYQPSGFESAIDGHTLPASITTASSSYVQVKQNAANLTTALSNIAIYTNAADGYDLSVYANGADADLHNGDYTIAAVAGTPTVSTNVGWAFKVADNHQGNTNKGVINSDDTSGSEYDYADWSQMAAGSTNALTLVSSEEATSGGDEFIVNYGVATAADQAAGVYSTQLVYTATTK